MRRAEREETRARGSDPGAIRIRESEQDPMTESNRPCVEQGARGGGPRPHERGRATHRGRRTHQEQGAGVAALDDSVRWGGPDRSTHRFDHLPATATAYDRGWPQEVGPGAEGGGGWVSAVIAPIVFFTGGSAAGMTSMVRGMATGLLNGFLCGRWAWC